MGGLLANGLLEAMVEMSQGTTKYQPAAIALFQQHRPHAYKSALVLGSSLFSDAPLLRVGDSLLSGDPNWSSGLLTHLWVIRALLMCRIWGEEDDLSRGGSRGWGRANQRYLKCGERWRDTRPSYFLFLILQSKCHRDASDDIPLVLLGTVHLLILRVQPACPFVSHHRWWEGRSSVRKYLLLMIDSKMSFCFNFGRHLL